MSEKSVRKMPSQKSIYKFWHQLGGREILSNHSITLEVQFDSFGKTKLDCFACGSSENIQRCHIDARSVGGNDEVSNLHLLCARCHVESEMLSGERYWIWLKSMIENHWCSFTEHILNRREKLGFSNEKLLEVYKKSGLDAAIEYMAYFESDTQSDVESFKSSFKEKLEKLKKLADKNHSE